MADIRINSLPSTATSTATDDFFAIDGATNGTRKMSAFNPVFSGASGITTSDVVFGSSGPSAKSSIAARAARQGLVFDGTSRAYVGFTQGAGAVDRTFHVVVSCPSSNPAAEAGIWVTSAGTSYGSEGGSSLRLAVQTDGVLRLQLNNSDNTGFRKIERSGFVSAYAGKNVALTVVINTTASTAVLYENGVLATTSESTGGASVPAWSAAPTTTYLVIGNGYSASTYWNGFIGPLYPYNRALSAAEVVALYEAGVPAGADYNNAGTTDIKPSAGTYAYWFGTGSISSATASSFTIAAGASLLAVRNVSGTFSGVSGRRYRATIVASGLNSAADFGSQGFTSNLSAGNVSNGTNVIEFTVTSTASGYFAVSSISSTAGGSISISSIVALGLLLAPDAGQAGGGLTWYDTSGNAANITLPSSGVTWNVPTSSKVATGWTFGGSVGLTGLTQTSGTDTQWSLLNSSLSTQISLAVGKAASSGNAMYFAWAYNGGTPYGYIETYGGGSPIALQKGGGNVLIGTTVNSTGLLQIGTNTTTSAGGIGFGTNTSLYRSGTGSVAVTTSSAGSWSQFTVVPNSAASSAVTSYEPYGSVTGSNPIWFAGQRFSDHGKFSVWAYNGSSHVATAFAIDNSQNATFAGTVATTGPVTSSGAGYTNSGFKITNTSASRTTGWFLTNAGVSALRDVTGAADLFDVDLGGNGTFRGWAAVKDGVTAPSATSGYAKIYVDTADGDLKVIFGDGTVKTIVTDS